jgi:hypothetical protein
MENSKPIIDESTTIIVAPTIEDPQKQLRMKRINKLIGLKSIELAKDEALDESATLNEADLDEVLSKDEYRFYQIKRKAYLTSWPELAEDPFDLDNLHLMIMEQVHQRQLLKKKKKSPGIDISKERQDSIKRQQDFMKSLNVRRTDRMKTKGEKKVENNIAHISMHFGSEDQVNLMSKRMEELTIEESELENKKQVG